MHADKAETTGKAVELGEPRQEEHPPIPTQTSISVFIRVHLRLDSV